MKHLLQEEGGVAEWQSRRRLTVPHTRATAGLPSNSPLRSPHQPSASCPCRRRRCSHPASPGTPNQHASSHKVPRLVQVDLGFPGGRAHREQRGRLRPTGRRGRARSWRWGVDLEHLLPQLLHPARHRPRWSAAPRNIATRQMAKTAWSDTQIWDASRRVAAGVPESRTT